MAFVNRLLGVVLGLALVAAGVILVLETAWVAAGQPPLLVDRDRIGETLGGEQLTWASTLATGVLLGLVLVGLLLLVLQLVPRQPTALAIDGADGRSAAVDRKALASQLRAAVTEDREVLGARSTVTKRKATVRARAVPGAETADVRSRLQETVGSTLAALQLDGRVRPTVSVSRSRERGA